MTYKSPYQSCNSGEWDSVGVCGRNAANAKANNQYELAQDLRTFTNIHMAEAMKTGSSGGLSYTTKMDIQMRISGGKI